MELISLSYVASIKLYRWLLSIKLVGLYDLFPIDNKMNKRTIWYIVTSTLTRTTLFLFYESFKHILIFDHTKFLIILRDLTYFSNKIWSGYDNQLNKSLTTHLHMRSLTRDEVFQSKMHTFWKRFYPLLLLLIQAYFQASQLDKT